MKQKYARLLVARSPGSLTRSVSLPVFGEGVVYIHVQVSLRGDPALIGEATFSAGSGSAPYSLSITDDEDAVDSRVVAISVSNSGAGYSGVLAVDPGATFPSGQVTAEVLFEAPEGFSFVWSSDGGPSFVLTLQAD